MNDMIKAAFNSVHASGELKSKTQAFITQKSRNYSMRRSADHKKIIPVTVCAALALFAGIKLYFTPTTHINIDINPSIDLGINFFDRVVSVKALNNDGASLLNDLDLKFSSYDEALRRILNNGSVEAMLSDNGTMTVTVLETNSAQSANILACAGGYGKVHCHSVSSKQASEANELGLSYEKYFAYLELSAIAPDITSEKIRNMSMREIRDLTTQLTETGNQFNDHNNDHSEYDDHNNDHSGNDDHNEHNSYTEPESNYSVPTVNGHHGENHGHGHG